MSVFAHTREEPCGARFSGCSSESGRPRRVPGPVAQARDVARPLCPMASADDNTSARAALQEVTVSGVASPTGEAAHTSVERPGPPVPICLLALAPGPGRATRGGRSLLVGDEGE